MSLWATSSPSASIRRVPYHPRGGLAAVNQIRLSLNGFGATVMPVSHFPPNRPNGLDGDQWPLQNSSEPISTTASPTR